MNIHFNIQGTIRTLAVVAILGLSWGSPAAVGAARVQAGRQDREPSHPVLRRADRHSPDLPDRDSADLKVEEVTVPTGRLIHLRLEESLNSRYNRVGDRFTASIVEPVQVDGRVVLPQGTRVIGRVTSVTRAGRASKAGTLGVEFVSIERPSGEYDLMASLASLDESENERIDEEGAVKGESSKKRNAVFIGGGAGVGAAIGAISGGGKGAGVGAAAGAVAGVAGALLSKGKEVELNPGAEFGMRLERDLVIPAEAEVR